MIQGACDCDHCHLAVTIHPTAAIADFIRVLKCNLSGWLHKTSPDMKSFAWHDGYAAFSVSSSVLPRVIEYISTQQEHHKKMSFQEELISLLDKHGVEYDKQYILA
jgi:REP element-mobilizing transposase RayT